MIHGRTEGEVQNYDIFKGIVTALLLLTLFLLAMNPAVEVAVPPVATEVAQVVLTAPELLSPAPGAVVEPGNVTFSGMGVPLSVAALLVDGMPAAQTAVAADGSWQMNAELAEGQRSIELQALDSGGNVAAAAPAFVINVAASQAEAPTAEAPSIAPDTLPLEVVPPGPEMAAGMARLSGRGQPGFDVALTVDGLDVGSTKVGDDGAWSFDLPLGSGTYTVSARQLTPDGAEVGPAQEFGLNVAEQVIPTVNLPSGDVRSGVFVFTGTGAPSARILLFAAGNLLGETTVKDDGTWELPAQLEPGDLEIDIATIGADGVEGERMPAISLPVLPAAEGETAVAGTVTYLQRIALPDDAIVTIQLQDVSRPDAPAIVLGEQVIEANGDQVPFAFNIPYDPADIVENGTYVIRATVSDADGTLLFTSDTVMPVITGDNPSEGVDVVMVPAVPGTETSPEALVTGTVTYLQRSALAPTDTVTVQIQDTSLADAPATVLGEQVITVGDKQVPIDYAVAYDPAETIDTHTYTMSARIEDADGNLLFINDTAIPVITNGNPTTAVEIQTVPVETAAESTALATVNGSVTYPERIALPADAVVKVSLQDISTPGAAATEIGSQEIQTAGAQVPIPYEISYDPAVIVDNHTYAVRARIENAQGDLLYTSDTVTPVITNGNPTEGVEIVAVPVPTVEAPPVEFDPNAESAVEAVETPADTTTFNTLVDGLDAAGLTEVLSDANAAFTLFAPTDAAFETLPPEIVAAWNANPARYAEMMSYLVVEGAYPPDELTDGQVLRTIAGTNIGITKDGDQVSVNGVPTSGDVAAGNSVVYALSEVILAPLRPGITPPLIDEKGVPVFVGPLLTVVGVGEPGKRILLQVDGENFGEIATVDDNEFWLVAQDIDSGVHQILAYMLEDDDTLMAISQLVILPVP